MRLSFVEGASPDKWLRVWRERHPHDPMTVEPVAEAEQWSALDAGLAELAIVRVSDDPAALAEARRRGFAVELYRERSVVVFPHDHPYADAASLTVADIAEFERTPEQKLVADTLAVTAAGVGLVVLPLSVARVHHRKDLVPVELSDGPEWPVLLVWREDSALIQDFVGITRGRGAQSSR
ncbi:MAG: LysR family transcriptional regulator substrate-binding protein [Microbacteriaceae bacterium]